MEWFLSHAAAMLFGVLAGFVLGRIHERRAYAKSEYAKMKAEFDEQKAEVRERIAKARKRFDSF